MGDAVMKKTNNKGRPAVDYRTVQARVEEESLTILKKIAGLSGQSVPELMRDWLLPLAKAELARRLTAETKNLAK
jgi:hypothetical protein